MNLAQDYYKRIILDYLVSDAQHLLAKQETRSGLLLAPVNSGIDAIGGALLGFGIGSSKRSQFVMKEHMGMPPELARFVYESLRCGLVHQGTAKHGLRFFAEYDPITRHKYAYDGGDNWIYLDSVFLAQQFISAAISIWDDHRELIVERPGDYGQSYDVVKSILPSIHSFLVDLKKCRTTNDEMFDESYWRASASSTYIAPSELLKNVVSLPSSSQIGLVE